MDKKYDENKENKDKNKFNIPENLLEGSIEINNKFMIIRIYDLNIITKLSPAFLNRFDIIILESQSEEINKGDKIDEEKFKELINILLEKEEEKTQLDLVVDSKNDDFLMIIVMIIRNVVSIKIVVMIKIELMIKIVVMIKIVMIIREVVMMEIVVMLP